MIFIHINSKSNNVSLLDKYINQGKDIFVLVYMEGCGPCNATRPEWKKIKNILDKKYKNNNNIVVADIDQEEFSKVTSISYKPVGFPSLFYMNKKNNIHENYEDCIELKEKDRTVDSFINWIETKVKKNNIRQNGGKKTLKKRRRWSLKYKRSINCKRPRGFSQKQYCKYGKK